MQNVSVVLYLWFIITDELTCKKYLDALIIHSMLSILCFVSMFEMNISDIKWKYSNPVFE